MKYHDTASVPDSTLMHWLNTVLDDSVVEIRMQTGYFRFAAVQAVAKTLLKAAEDNLLTHVVIGANEGDTTQSDASNLLLRLGLERSNAKYGVVSFSNALFHPKVYHITREDGSQAAFVGSPNFSKPGLNGSNVEAGISLDTSECDPPETLSEIAAAIDRWFQEPKMGGFSEIRTEADIIALVAAGVLSKKRPPRTSGGMPSMLGARGVAQTRRPKLIVLPPWPADEDEEGAKDDDNGPEPEVNVPPNGTNGIAGPTQAIDIVEPFEPGGAVAPGLMPVVSRPGFPPYLRFEPESVEPTYGIYATTGLPLPGNAIGLILKLKRANSRYFRNESGNADVNVPITAAVTIRFGISGKHGRPRADITLSVLYIADDELIIDGGTVNSNISGYGYTESETGHPDIRLFMPAAVKGLVGEIKLQDRPLPGEGDIFVLKWPTEDNASYELAFLAPDSGYAVSAAGLYDAADTNHQLDGGACWLHAGDLPDWPA